MLKPNLKYLKQYHRDVEIVPDSFVDISEIPLFWKQILSLPTAERRITEILATWRKCLAKELRNTIHYLQENLVDIHLIKYRDIYSLLYSVRASDGQIQYYEGGNPGRFSLAGSLRAERDRFPSSIVNCYQNLHNGFFQYENGGMGLVPASDIVIFDDEDWGILEELPQPLPIRLETTFGLFASGMGGYVAIDSSNCEDCKAALWFTKKPPRYGVNFWDLVDEWTVIGMQG